MDWVQTHAGTKWGPNTCIISTISISIHVPQYCKYCASHCMIYMQGDLSISTVLRAPTNGTRRVILSSQGTTHERQIREFHYCSGSISILQSIDRSPTRRRRRCCCQPPTGRQPLSIPLWESRVWISSLATLGAQLRASYSLTVLSSPRVDAVSYILLAIKSLLLHYFCVAEGGEKVPSWGLLFCFGHEFSMRLSTCPPLFIPAEFDVWGFWSGVTTSHQYFFTLKIVGVFFFLVYLLLQIQQNG